MKKIGILTYHSGYNYGASLQAYALQKVIKNLNYEVEIINFEKDDFIASREMITKHPKRIKEIVKIMTRIPYRSSLKKRQQLFDDYTQKTLLVTKPLKVEQEVIDIAEQYDVIVCGSDQIWNVSGLDPVSENMIFFLNFEKKQKRVAYAASFGTKIEESIFREKEFLPWIKRFDYISVREENAKKYLEDRGIKCEISLDPTILLDKDDYNCICDERIVKEPYILMFGWNTNHDLIKAAKKASKYFQLPIYNIVPPPRGMTKGVKRKLDIGPKQFLSMIKYANFIVTNSFHGTVFSTIYEKPFVSVISEKPDERMKSVLDQLGLEHRLCKVEDIDFSIIKESDYKDVKRKKTVLREKSLKYIEFALGD